MKYILLFFVLFSSIKNFDSILDNNEIESMDSDEIA